MAISDFRTNARLRQILSRHWVDLQSLRFGSFRGTVRLTGTLNHLSGKFLLDTRLNLIEVLEQEIRRIPGVRAVYFDLVNWIRDTDGRWKRVDERSKIEFSESEVLEAIEPEEEPDDAAEPR